MSFPLFIADTNNSALETFLNHQDWRVRAALAEALGDQRFPRGKTGLAVLSRLVQDLDYKVRAAVAHAVTRAPAPVADQHVTTLLADDNWHVRERTLQGLDRPASEDRQRQLATSALKAIHADSSWRRCPAHIRHNWHRLQILHEPIPGQELLAPGHHGCGPNHDDHRALLTVLREIRTGHLALPAPRRQAIVDRGRCSTSWLVRHEAERLRSETGDGSPCDGDPRLNRERFRRSRGQRAVQIALDMHDIDDALAVARAAAEAGADFIEVGDPLIKETGIRAIEQTKAAVPDATVVAEMMSADWGRDQVLLAAQAGADVVLLIGPASTASVAAAVKAGQRLGVPILLDVPAATTYHWVTEMERAGVDGFTITTNIDLGIGNTTALDAARELRAWTQLPVAVSGGFSSTDHAIFASPDWDILIVGRSVADATDPAAAAARIIELARHTERHP